MAATYKVWCIVAIVSPPRACAARIAVVVSACLSVTTFVCRVKTRYQRKINHNYLIFDVWIFIRYGKFCLYTWRTLNSLNCPCDLQQKVAGRSNATFTANRLDSKTNRLAARLATLYKRDCYKVTCIDYLSATCHVARRIHGSGTGSGVASIVVPARVYRRTCMVVVSPPRVMFRFYARMRVYGKFARVVTRKDIGKAGTCLYAYTNHGSY